MSRTPTNGIDYTSKDYESFRNDMINQLGVKMPEYTDLRQSDAGIVILELLAQGLDVISYYQDVIANEAFLVTEEQRSNALKWCEILGYVPRPSTPSEFNQVFVLIDRQTTDTLIPAGTVVSTLGTLTEPSIYFETVDDLIIPAGSLGNEKDDYDNYLYTVKVVQGVTINSEIVGTSTGAPSQSFTLGYSPVILDSISVIIDEGRGFVEWNRVDNFVDSTATSRDYTAVINENDEAVITFGDGVFGKIPLEYNNGIYCNYRIGGGLQGNVGAGKICLLDSNLALVAETFNPETAEVEGLDKETLDEIKKNAPNAYRVKWGALTAKDFSDIISMKFTEVDKVVSYVNEEDSQNLDIYILLKNDAPLTQDIIQSILDLFDENKGGRKIVGAGNINLLPAIKVPISITATLAVRDRYEFDSVKRKVEVFIQNYFELGNRDFDTEFIPANLIADVMNPENAIEGIRYFRVNTPIEDSLSANRGEIHILSSLTIENGGS